ncbi:uncharacterized protein LOC119674088 [Teleopsis dalmanni]|uniref:uncharacterized protein LOC119670374 n=1 Tax=Teleopsis dalmanni TaxID=139649 RepID=UPI000D32B966|nr:uncharacterized protein LOC119670374 [Teleopsis dalmanni]XP_037941144.1 uncharacterized protein LOC119674088 [Teleopsis dalmanni]
MQQRVVKILCLIFAVSFFFLQVYGKCNECQQNDIACIDETQFHICAGGQIDNKYTFKCPENTICTDYRAKCMPADSGITPSCTPDAGCGICSPPSMFTCLSRTQFAQCNGAEITTNVGVCPDGFTCDTATSAICVNDCNNLTNLSCDRDPITL